MTEAQQERQRTLRDGVHWAIIGFVIVAADLLGLYVYLGRRDYLLNPVWIYLVLYTILFLGYVYASARLVPRLPRVLSRYTVPLILIFGVLYRVAVLPAPPSLTTDMDRYVWDGRLTTHGINPYRWTPNAQTLRSLRDPLWNQMEYKAYQTIYMPVSQAVFALCNAIFGNNLTGYKLIYMLFDLGVMAVLLLLLRQLGRPPTQIIWYAWCPLPITEISLAGHQDIIGVFFLLLTLLLVRFEKLQLLGAVTLVASIMTKGFALLLLPLFCRRYGIRFTIVAAVSLIYLGMPMWVYLPEFLHGMRQYLENVHVNSGIFHFVNMGLHLITRRSYDVTVKISDITIFCVMLWAAWTPTASFSDLIRRSFIVLAATLLVVPTLFSWYLIWVIPFMGLLGRRPSWSFVLLTWLVVLLYTFYISIKPLAWIPFVEYAPFYIALAWEYWAWLRGQGSHPAEKIRNYPWREFVRESGSSSTTPAVSQSLEI